MIGFTGFLRRAKAVAGNRIGQPGEWLAWSRALWIGAAACTVIALLTSVWTPSMTEDDTSFSQGVEQTILASSDDFDTAR